MEEKTPYSDIDFQIRLMTDTYYMNMSEFSCGVELLDKFFHYEIKECVNHHYLSAYCAFLDSTEIVAVFTYYFIGYSGCRLAGVLHSCGSP